MDLEGKTMLNDNMNMGYEALVGQFLGKWMSKEVPKDQKKFNFELIVGCSP